MPLFDYRCKKCGHMTYDVLINNKNAAVVQKCGCGSAVFEKIVPKVAVRFKGDGWSGPKREPKEEE
jgi:putative FmdB family regulatory protein